MWADTSSSYDVKVILEIYSYRVEIDALWGIIHLSDINSFPSSRQKGNHRLKKRRAHDFFFITLHFHSELSRDGGMSFLPEISLIEIEVSFDWVE